MATDQVEPEVDKEAGALGAPASDPSKNLNKIQREIDAKKAPIVEPPVAGAKDAKNDATPPAPEKPLVHDQASYDKWFAEQPQEAKAAFAANVVRNYTEKVKERFGTDVWDLLEEIGSDQTGELAKRVGRLKDKKLRQFIFEQAYAIADDPRYSGGTPEAGGTPAPNAEIEALKAKQAELEGQLTARAQQEAADKVIARRQLEHNALLGEYPELRYDASKPQSPEFLRVQEIIDRALAQTAKTGREVSFKEAYEDMKRVFGETAFAPRNVVPDTSPAGAPPARQAPKDDLEAKRRMRETLEKHGGLKGLANNIAAGKR